MTDEEILAKAAYDLAAIAAPIYAQYSPFAAVRPSQAMELAVKDAARLITYAKEFITTCA